MKDEGPYFSTDPATVSPDPSLKGPGGNLHLNDNNCYPLSFLGFLSWLLPIMKNIMGKRGYLLFKSRGEIFAWEELRPREKSGENIHDGQLCMYRSDI